MHMAKILTFPELVTEHNIARLRQNVLNGRAPASAYMHFLHFSIEHPAAVVVDHLVAACKHSSRTTWSQLANISRAVMVTNAGAFRVQGPTSGQVPT